jgi:aspartate racemase
MKLKLLQRHPRWEHAQNYFVFPSDDEQRQMHELIYEVKLNRNLNEACQFVEKLMTRHNVDSFVVACSEIHLLAKQFEPSVCIDPLSIIAQNVVEQNRHEA